MTEPIRLNLGCGHKLSRGWVNYDLHRPAFKGDPPPDITFVQGDVRKLEAFADNSVDEIFAGHIIEHIEIFDVMNTLKEWHRVLKPGGLLAIECPNLIKCCINFLQVVTTQDEDIAFAWGLRGIYGASMQEGDGMGHKFGYWPANLIDRLVTVGFVDAEEARPMTKEATADLRDFRVEARKPIPAAGWVDSDSIRFSESKGEIGIA